ncbi:MAG: sugar transferase, partial [Actinomycetota bacterium]
MLIGEKPIEPNTTYDLKMHLPVEIRGKRHLELEASSRWCRRNGSNELFTTGFKLSDTEPDDLDAIRHICSNPTLHSREAFTGKRLFDILASSFGLLFLLPIFLLISLATKLASPGPAYFAAKRVGKFGKPFRMYKFRTMTESPGGTGPNITAHDDPRVTSIGRFLRLTKLNELPQLFNVLRGEMSFVGPRPEYPEFVAHYTPEQREVLSVKPGITSLATISYAGEEKMLSFSGVTETYLRSILPDKLRLDLLYVGNRSLLLD